MRPDPGRGGGVGNNSFGSFGSLSLWGLGDAAAEEVAVLEGPILFFEMVDGPGAGAISCFFTAIATGAGAFWADGSTIADGANLLTVGEGGTEV
jgi:hypothetical protein